DRRAASYLPAIKMRFPRAAAAAHLETPLSKLPPALRLAPLAAALFASLAAPSARAHDREDPTDLSTVLVRSAAGFEQAIADAPACSAVGACQRSLPSTLIYITHVV